MPRSVRVWANEQLHQPLSVAQLAHHANMSVRHFTRSFRAETGTSPSQWLVEQRVLAARRLLETPDLPIEQVATRAGFGSAAALRMHFAKLVRTTPVAYRRAFRGQARSR